MLGNVYKIYIWWYRGIHVGLGRNMRILLMYNLFRWGWGWDGGGCNREGRKLKGVSWRAGSCKTNFSFSLWMSGGSRVTITIAFSHLYLSWWVLHQHPAPLRGHLRQEFFFSAMANIKRWWIILYMQSLTTIIQNPNVKSWSLNSIWMNKKNTNS